MVIEKDCVVGIHVRMYDLQKHLLEETEPEGVTYLHGHGDIFPRLEQALEGKKAGDTVNFGGLFGFAPVMPVNAAKNDAFIERGGRIPAPLHSLKN